MMHRSATPVAPLNAAALRATVGQGRLAALQQERAEMNARKKRLTQEVKLDCIVFVFFLGRSIGHRLESLFAKRSAEVSRNMLLDLCLRCLSGKMGELKSGHL